MAEEERLRAIIARTVGELDQFTDVGLYLASVSLAEAGRTEDSDRVRRAHAAIGRARLVLNEVAR